MPEGKNIDFKHQFYLFILFAVITILYLYLLKFLLKILSEILCILILEATIKF